MNLKFKNQNSKSQYKILKFLNCHFAFCILLFALAVLFSAPWGATHAYAASVDDLREKISERAADIRALEEEIAKYQGELSALGKQARTLDTAIRELELTVRKLATDIRLTEKKISSAALTIRRLTKEIGDKAEKIGHGTGALALALRSINELESRSIVEVLLAHRSFSSFWNTVASLNQFQTSVRDNVETLQQLKKTSEARKARLETERKNLVALKARLNDQKIIVAANKREKNTLLKETKNKESNYSILLEKRVAQKEALEREIAEFEAQLSVEIDPDSLPPTGTGILAWPLDSVFVTQYFGKTPFASKNPQVYSGAGHNGVDFRASVGTVVRSAANGVVVDTGNTDARNQCPGASYGKWVLVRHYNGLSTLYAHLSLIRVEPAEEVRKGDAIGYSGNTGYSTGPHLHFAAYASSAVRVTNNYKSRVCGTNLKLPVSPRNGYLNPLSYLPSLE